MHSDTSYWSRLQERLRAILEPEEFATWFAPLVVRSENEAGLVLGAPNERFVHTLEESYRDTQLGLAGTGNQAEAGGYAK